MFGNKYFLYTLFLSAPKYFLFDSVHQCQAAGEQTRCSLTNRSYLTLYVYINC